MTNHLYMIHLPKSFKITNYDYELSSHPISNTQSDFSPGPGVRRRSLGMNHRRSQGHFRASRQPQLCPKEPAHLLPAEKCLISPSQQESRCKAVHEEIPMFLGFQVMYTVSDFERNNYFRLIKPVNEHFGRCSHSYKQHTRSDQISQNRHSKVLVGRGRKPGRHWLTCTAKKELCLPKPSSQI